MQLIDAPDKLVLPFAGMGAKNTIPVDSQIGIVGGAASLTDGFPPLTRTPLIAGGVPPSGLDMNGILFEISDITRWANAGGGYPYDSNFATDSNVGGYPKGSRVLRSDGQGYWINTVDDNATNPESSGVGWVPDFAAGVTAVTMTNANVTLTALQYGKPIIIVSGLLTANLNLIFPDLAKTWTIINNTTGAFSITCKTAAGTGVTVQAVKNIVGDGTNIYFSNTTVFNNTYDSGDLTFVAADGNTFSHGLGGYPKLVQVLLHCATAELNYSVGDYVNIASNADFDGSTSKGVQVFFLASTSISFRVGSNPTGSINLLNRATGVLSTITNANWKLVIRAYS